MKRKYVYEKKIFIAAYSAFLFLKILLRNWYMK